MHEIVRHKAQVSVVIVNWNAGPYLKRCLLSVSKQTRCPNEIIIVDNASKDGSADGIEEAFPRVKVVRLEKNIGFAAANNYAVRLASNESRWVALLNPDAFPEPSWLERLLAAADVHPECAFWGSRLIQADHPGILDGEGDYLHISGWAWRKNRGISAAQKGENPVEIFSPCAAAALYRRDAWEAAGGLDEDFFCYFEDVDLGFRLRLAGHRCLMAPDAEAYHIGSAVTGGRHSDFAIYHGHRNLVWTYVKNMPGPLFWLLIPLHIALNLASVVWFCMRGKGRIILKAKLDAFRGIPRMWQKRDDIQKNRSVSAGEIWKALNKSILPRLSESFKVYY